MPPLFPIPRIRASYAIALGLFWVLLAPLTAWPHPLGDFSINQYFIVDGTEPALRIHYLLDVAEIPSFTELDLLDTNFDSEISKPEVDTYLAQRIPQLVEHLHLRVDGAPTPLTLLRHKLILLQGNAGMVVFNILLELEARELSWPPSGPISVSVASENYPQEQGTRECLILPGSAMVDTTVAPQGTQKRVPLEDLPGVYVNDTASFTLSFAPGAPSVPPGQSDASTDFSWTSTARLAREQGELGMTEGIAQAMLDSEFQTGTPSSPGAPILSIAQDLPEETFGTGTREAPDTFTNRLMNRVSVIVRDQNLPMPMLAFGLLIAALLGMGHAWAPGHGKTVMAAYLIGENGTVWHAVILGIVVTLIHTWSVIFLGLVTLFFEGYLSETQVNFWTGIVSGLIIVVIGVVLFRQRYQHYLVNAQGEGGDWRFHHGHEHGPEETVSPCDTESAPPSYRNILWLGVSGGVVPCPAALLVLLLALKVGRLSYGLGLILAFSLGLAAVL
ncbi:MAG: sulfite exporter TauE/SafE family protein, partial [Candidatus Hydrogenedentes bacterium]|nr:sulfite exporter TauE/SafE family protein [Candidatus Hydrogenedentota bacterium]